MNGKKAQIMIIGGSGLIGRKLYRELSNDYHVIITGRNIQKMQLLIQEAPFINWQENTKELQSLLEKTDIVINLAGKNIISQKWNEQGQNSILVSRISIIQQFYNMISKCKQKPRHWIQASAVGFYGETIRPTSESAEKGEGFLADLSYAMEKEASRFEEIGIRTTFIRTGLVLCKNGGVLPKFLSAFKYHLGGHFGNGEAFFPWIHIEDEIKAIRFIIENENISGPVNICAPENITNKIFCKKLAKTLGRSSWLHAPAPILKILMGKQMAQEVLLQGQCTIPQKLLDEGFIFKYTKIKMALDNILKQTKK